jgi:hypothetical protein
MTQDHDHEEDDDEEFDLYSPITDFVIFERATNDETVPEGFSAVTYKLDLSPSSHLRWNVPESSLPIIFDLDFGLFGPNWKGVLHQGFFQSCQFALNHFVKELGNQARGVILARLTLPVSQDIVEYLELLANALPCNMSRLLLLDASNITDAKTFSEEIRSDRFGPFTIAIHSSLFATKNICWKKGIRTSGFIGQNTPEIHKFSPSCAFLLHKSEVTDFSHVMDDFIREQRQFKVIPEEQLTAEWDGIDELIITTRRYQESTMRAIDGFKAAGAEVRIIDVKGH